MLARASRRATHCFVVQCALFGSVTAQDGTGESESFVVADAVTVSKYVWRGQRLTNDWSLQPSFSGSIGHFSFGVWGTMDLRAVNEGDALLLSENPGAPANRDDHGLRGKFSQIDFSLSYSRLWEPVAFQVGTIAYTFPEQAVSKPTTTELYGSIGLPFLPLAPSATLYVDVDESSRNGGSAVYFVVAAGHLVLFDKWGFEGLELGGSISMVNDDFGRLHYGADEAGLHDVTLLVRLPIGLGWGRWSASAFLAYSQLLGDFRAYQFVDRRQILRGSPASPESLADTLWGGVAVRLTF